MGDELGSRVLATRLVLDVVRLAFLLERRYAPYSKWLGSAFARLEASRALRPAFLNVVHASDYGAREAALIAALQELAARHNALGLTRPIDTTVRLFHTRPFRVVGSARFVDACLERVTDPWLRSLPLAGAIDQLVDSSDVLREPRVFAAMSSAFDLWAT